MSFKELTVTAFFIGASVPLTFDGIQMLLNASHDIDDIRDMTYVPQPNEGECIYLNPDVEQVISYSGLTHGATIAFVKAVLPNLSNEGQQLAIKEPIGSIPVYDVAPCRVLNSDVTQIFESRAEAIVYEAENSSSLSMELEALFQDYPSYSVVKFEEIALP